MDRQRMGEERRMQSRRSWGDRQGGSCRATYTPVVGVAFASRRADTVREFDLVRSAEQTVRWGVQSRGAGASL